MSKTISSSYTSDVRLTSTASNPVTLTSAARLIPTYTAYAALYGAGGTGEAWAITNAGVINGGTTGNGIQLGSGGTYVGASVVTNQAGGTISGNYGIRLYDTAASTVTNLSGATITATGARGVFLYHAGTVNNSGVIAAPTANSQQIGILLEDGGVVVNNAGGTISGNYGVVLLGPGTVTNAGAIKAVNTGKYAVQFDASGSRLIVDPGAVFLGRVSGGSGTLELEGTTIGTLSASGFKNFSAIKFDAGSKWTITGDAATAFSGGILGFGLNETLNVTGFVAVSATYASGGLTLTNAINAHSTLHFSGGALNSGNFHVASDGAGGTNIDFLACYAKGTRIATEFGEVPIEQLREGDRVRGHLSGQLTPVLWIGHRRVDCARHSDPGQVWPVRIRAGAFGDAKPTRDLFVSPNHAVFLDDVLIPARCLINGTSIMQIAVGEVIYYHLELPRHDVVLAEGMPAESWLDTGDRSNFANGGGPMRLFPDFASGPADAAMLWETMGCARLVVHGPELEAVRFWVNTRADGMADRAYPDTARDENAPDAGQIQAMSKTASNGR